MVNQFIFIHVCSWLRRELSFAWVNNKLRDPANLILQYTFHLSFLGFFHFYKHHHVSHIYLVSSLDFASIYLIVRFTSFIDVFLFKVSMTLYSTLTVTWIILQLRNSKRWYAKSTEYFFKLRDFRIPIFKMYPPPD